MRPGKYPRRSEPPQSGVRRRKCANGSACLPFGFRWARTVFIRLDAKGFQMTTYTQRRHLWPILPFGFDNGGYATEGDVLVNVSADGVDLNVIWGQIKAALDAWNAERGALTNLLSFWTSNTADAIPQAVADQGLQEASEFGIPDAIRAPTEHLLLGYEFSDYDIRTAFTWKFLRDATADQIRAHANLCLAADDRTVQGTILQRLFDNTPAQNEWGHTVYSLFNGDAQVPPAYLGKNFTAPHQHYLTSGSTDIDSNDVETLIRLVTEHGFGVEPGSQIICLVNPTEAEQISQWKAGVLSANGAVAKFDYLPSLGSPAWLTPENIMGQQAPAEFNKLKVNGSYGPAYIIQSDFVPEHYVSVFATYGPNHPSNVIGVRQHPNPTYQGFRPVGGNVPGYPIQDAIFARGFGVGTRRRGAAAVMEITEDATYDVPEIPK